MKKLRMILFCSLIAIAMFPVTMHVLAKGSTARRPVVTIEKISGPQTRLRANVMCHVDCDGDGPPYEWSGETSGVGTCLDQCETTCGGECEVLSPAN